MVRLLAAATGLAAVVALLSVAPAAAASGSRSARARPAAPREPPLVVGVDGADWRLMEPLLARGDAPEVDGEILDRLRALGYLE